MLDEEATMTTTTDRSSTRSRAQDRKATRAIRLASRVIGSMAAALWIFVIIASVFEEEAGDGGLVGWVLGGLVLVGAAGVVVAYVNERLGAVILLAAGAALAVFAFVTAGRNHLLAFGVSGAPFLVAGGLALIASWREVREEGVPK